MICVLYIVVVGDLTTVSIIKLSCYTLFVKLKTLRNVSYAFKLFSIIKKSKQKEELSTLFSIVIINLHFQRALESIDGTTPIPHMAVCIIATLILLPCIFLRDLKV